MAWPPCFLSDVDLSNRLDMWSTLLLFVMFFFLIDIFLIDIRLLNRLDIKSCIDRWECALRNNFYNYLMNSIVVVGVTLPSTFLQMSLCITHCLMSVSVSIQPIIINNQRSIALFKVRENLITLYPQLPLILRKHLWPFLTTTKGTRRHWGR